MVARKTAPEGFDIIIDDASHFGDLTKMGIIDAVPIAHSLRKSGFYYQHDKARAEMKEFLAHRPHLSPGEAFFILESYAA
ncbi:MAG: hypothetical protein ND866_01945 [Pyrinomonadaceae bacterium]|nr:hypothetical protein [Pyrinomonadaceae bacterium]